MARDAARRLLGEVVKGDDPTAAKRAKRKAAAVTELCDAYLEAAEAGRILTRRREAKKPSTLVTDKGRIERHIKPLLGRLKVSARAMTLKVSCTPSQRRDEGLDQDRQARLGARHGRSRNRHTHDGLTRRDLLVRGPAQAAGR
jgi:hypothetical protein